MEFKDITTWSVSKGVATPVNPSKQKLLSTGSNIKEWVEFDQSAKQHTYATNAPGGSYSADRFGEIVWQIQNPMTSQWVNTLDNKPNKEYSNRLFLQFKQLDNSILLKDLIIKIDAMTTKEFCDIFNYEPPSWKGDVKLAAVEFAYIDAMKWNIIKNKSKEPENPKLGEWISVKKKLPEICSDTQTSIILLVLSGSSIFEARQINFGKKKMWIPVLTCIKNYKITHWMPKPELPEPPKTL